MSIAGTLSRGTLPYFLFKLKEFQGLHKADMRWYNFAIATQVMRGVCEYSEGRVVNPIRICTQQ